MVVDTNRCCTPDLYMSASSVCFCKNIFHWYIFQLSARTDLFSLTRYLFLSCLPATRFLLGISALQGTFSCPTFHPVCAATQQVPRTWSVFARRREGQVHSVIQTKPLNKIQLLCCTERSTTTSNFLTNMSRRSSCILCLFIQESPPYREIILKTWISLMRL